MSTLDYVSTAELKAFGDQVNLQLDSLQDMLEQIVITLAKLQRKIRKIRTKAMNINRRTRIKACKACRELKEPNFQ
ncbi:hypothetical protein VTJ49DRAFT_3940 [Mycothermus thermophilus]|uniref:Uncharacterized protein n=1 Tax=Humicola insolens TaxID=85995 RepID=A0ABR3V6N8_HUMIN